MPRSQTNPVNAEEPGVSAGLQSNLQMRNPHLNCSHCDYTLECVEQNRRSGTWLGSFICPNCRSEYFYAYRWGRLIRKS
jgi:transposase-like protein